MSVLFSKSCEYALKAVLYLGTEPREHRQLLKISHALHIPYHFLEKLLQLLVKHGVVESHKGINGVFAETSCNKIMLIEVIRHIDGDVFSKDAYLALIRAVRIILARFTITEARERNIKYSDSD